MKDGATIQPIFADNILSCEVFYIQNQQIVINQHYIPQCILENFANDQNQVYEGLVERNRLYLTNYRNSMSERFTYEHSYIEINRLEKFFGRIETYMGPAMKNIIKTIEDYERGIKTVENIKENIYRYMREFLIFYYRSGALLHEFAFEQKKKEDRVLLLLGKILNSHYIRALSKSIIDHYNFCIIVSNNESFIVSDQFISTAALAIKNRFSNIVNRQIGLNNVIILLPISRKYYAVFFDGKIPIYLSSNAVIQLDDAQVDEINGVIINNSYVKCIGYRKEPIESAFVKFEYKSPTGVYAGFESGATMGATLKKEVFFYESDEKTWEFFTSMTWVKFKNLGRNDPCLCGSGKKFKKCCSEFYQDAQRIMDRIVRKEHYMNYKVSNDSVIEMSIDEFYSRPKDSNKDKK